MISEIASSATWIVLILSVLAYNLRVIKHKESLARWEHEERMAGAAKEPEYGEEEE